MAFRGNFLLRAIGELGSLVLITVFFAVIYGQTDAVAGWSKYQVLFLIGTHFLVTNLFRAFFFDNCLRVSEQIRTGELDFVLLKPIDPQFLLSIRHVDFSNLSQLPVGLLIVFYAVGQLDLSVSPLTIGLYIVLILCGTLILYSIMFMLATTSFWLIRNDNIFDMWWYVNSFSRYPADIYKDCLGGMFQLVMTYGLPVLIVANVPASSVVRASLQPSYLVLAMFVSTAFFFALSRFVFRFALRGYHSASS